MYRLRRPQELLSSIFSVSKKYSRSLVTNSEAMTKTNENTIVETMEKRPLENENESEAKKQKINEETQEASETATEVSFVRVKKRNYAMMLGYLGKDYYGMQRNPDIATVEDFLIKAMYKANLIDSVSTESMQKIHFQRAARTDKGVSAVRQVVSLKLPENPSKESINEHLPENIRVFSIKRATKGFNSKSKCNARTYSYTLPTFTFADHNSDLVTSKVTPEEIEERVKILSIINEKPHHEYRLTKEKQEKILESIKMYVGTHNFHNFTTKILPLDPRAKRYIMSFTADEPFIVDNMEFMTLKVKGQSFMMHQIRKMVSLIIGHLRGLVTMDEFKQTFGREKYRISRAPSLGLMLNIVHYDFYNKKYGKDGIHENLDWAECEDEIKDFEKNYILKHVIDTEINEKSMLYWLADLNSSSYGLRDEKYEFDKEDDD